MCFCVYGISYTDMYSVLFAFVCVVILDSVNDRGNWDDEKYWIDTKRNVRLVVFGIKVALISCS